MFLHSHIPRPPLDKFIDRFWLVSDLPPRPMERILPSGAMELVINLSGDEIRICDPSRPAGMQRRSGAVIAGAYSSPFLVDPLASIIGVHFRPGRAVRVLGVPANELAEAHVDLDALWGRSAAELRERIHEAATPAKRFAVLEEAFLGRLRQSAPRHRAIPAALNAFEQDDVAVKVRDLARRVGLSQRRFIQIFTAEVGLTPKLYGRVRRFQRARELARKATDPDWAALAVACGFFDQSHLIRDFGEFSGLSPEAYRNQSPKPIPPGPLPWVG